LTVSVRGMACIIAPLTPFIVIVDVARGVLDPVCIRRVVVPVLVREAGVKDAVAPLGSPVALKDTVDAKPPCIVNVTVVVFAVPRAAVKDVGFADSVNDLTVRVSGTSFVIAPLTALTVKDEGPPGVVVAV
jgi:hypothetical protein